MTKAPAQVHMCSKATCFSFLPLCSFLSLPLVCFLTCLSESLCLLHWHMLQPFLPQAQLYHESSGRPRTLAKFSLQTPARDTGPPAVWPEHAVMSSADMQLGRRSRLRGSIGGSQKREQAMVREQQQFPISS